jgi:hypothetical protein
MKWVSSSHWIWPRRSQQRLEGSLELGDRLARRDADSRAGRLVRIYEVDEGPRTERMFWLIDARGQLTYLEESIVRKEGRQHARNYSCAACTVHQIGPGVAFRS